MKEGIHPDYHPITVVMTDGTKYETRSTMGASGHVIQLDVDPKTHPAWVGGITIRKTGQMEKFSNKFAFLDTNKSEAKPEAKSAKAETAEVKAESADAKPAAPKKKEKKSS